MTRLAERLGITPGREPHVMLGVCKLTTHAPSAGGPAKSTVGSGASLALRRPASGGASATQRRCASTGVAARGSFGQNTENATTQGNAPSTTATAQMPWHGLSVDGSGCGRATLPTCSLPRSTRRQTASALCAALPLRLAYAPRTREDSTTSSADKTAVSTLRAISRCVADDATLRKGDR